MIKPAMPKSSVVFAALTGLALGACQPSPDRSAGQAAAAPAPVASAPAVAGCDLVSVQQVARATALAAADAKPSIGPWTAGCDYHLGDRMTPVAAVQLFDRTDTAMAARSAAAYPGAVAVEGVGQQAWWVAATGSLTAIVGPGRFVNVIILHSGARGGDTKAAAIDLAQAVLARLPA